MIDDLAPAVYSAIEKFATALVHHSLPSPFFLFRPVPLHVSLLLCVLSFALVHWSGSYPKCV